MRVLRRSSIPQRVVLVVALFLVLLIGWSWAYLDELQRAANGWFAYSPNTDVGFTDQYFVVHHRGRELLLVAVALVAVWSALSIWLLGLSPRVESDTQPQ